MIYDFFNRMTAGALANQFSLLFESGVSVKFIDYVELETVPVIKKFTFGIEGNVFYFEIKHDDTISMIINDGELNKVFKSGYKSVQEFKQQLISFIRDHKINQVI